jgi:tetratricopeptide (TPR) repeat protein
VSRLLGVILVLGLTACQRGPDRLPEADVALNNQGVGLLGQYRNDEAEAIFAELVARHPQVALLRSNQAIATLNRQTEGDEERALGMARALIAEDPENLEAQYIAGLAQLYLGQVEAALAHLLRVTAADPQDAHAAYFAGQALSQLGRTDEALELFLQALNADPYLRSAYYAAALALRSQQQGDRARALFAEYQRLQGNPRAKLAEFRYTRMGDKALARVLGDRADDSAAVPDGPLFGQPQRIQAALGEGTRSLLTADLQGDARQDLLILGAAAAQLLLQTDQGYRQLPLPDDFPHGAGAAAFGDLDNDGQLDLVVCATAGISLWRVGEGAELQRRGDLLPPQAASPCHDVQLFDADHDGDLDLYRIAGADAAGELFNNNLDGSWRALSAQSPLLRGPDTGTRQLLVLDADGDRDLDLLFVAAEDGVLWLQNDRLWAYQARTLSADWNRRWRAATAIDPQASGRPELVLADAAGDLWVGRLVDDSIQPLALAAELAPVLALSALDADGDGLEDLLLRHETGLSLIAADADGRWQLRWQHQGRVDSHLALLETPARGPSLAYGVPADGADESALWIAPPGPGRQAFLALAPSGRSAEAEGMRSNASGIGTQVRLRRGSRWSVADLLDRDSGRGQSLQPLALGLGRAGQADFVELQWSDGVMQTELGLAADRLHVVTETQRQLASCPVLFVWDGEDYRFVSDVLGVGGIGFLLAPGSYAEPRPWEWFRLPDDLAVPRDGAYRLKIAEPMEEAAFIDRVRLHVYDLPPGWAMAMDERMHTGGGPEPSGAPLFFQPHRAPRILSMHDQHGAEISALLADADFQAVDPGPRDPRFLGRLQREQQIDILLAQPLGAGQYALLGNGWVEYPYSQTLFAAWQAGAGYRSYSLDLGDGQGGWREAYAQFGYPAGMPREFSLPLPSSEQPIASLRLRGNLEVYLDRLQIVRVEAAPDGVSHQAVPPSSARMERIGFPRRAVLESKRPDYDFSRRSPFWDTRYPEGAYTDFGPVQALLEAVDDGFAIVGPGDALDLAFPAPADPPEGYRRVLVLEVRGYAKDMDLYTRDGGTLDPLPQTQGVDAELRAQGARLNQQFNRRFQGGR